MNQLAQECRYRTRFLDGCDIGSNVRDDGKQCARGRAPVDRICRCLSNSADMCTECQLPTLYHWKLLLDAAGGTSRVCLALEGSRAFPFGSPAHGIELRLAWRSRGVPLDGGTAPPAVH